MDNTIKKIKLTENTSENTNENTENNNQNNNENNTNNNNENNTNNNTKPTNNIIEIVNENKNKTDNETVAVQNNTIVKSLTKGTKKNLPINNGNITKKNNMTKEILETVCEKLFTHYIVMKMYHFQTKSYGAHKASDVYVTDFLTFQDLFMEVAQGIYGKLESTSHECSTKLYDDDTINGYISESVTMLDDLRSKVSSHSDLVNLLDDQIHRLNQLSYLLTFH
jgi:hypothetical protein